jgi:hypothetical protein
MSARLLTLALVATVVASAGSCKGDTAHEGSVVLDVAPCMSLVGGATEGSCGEALRASYEGDIPMCLAIRTSSGAATIPMWTDASTGALRAAAGAPEATLGSAGETVTLKLFYLVPEVDDPATACTTEAFDVDRSCGQADGCVMSTEQVSARVGSEGETVIRWGSEGTECAFECHDPAICGSASGPAAEVCDGRDNDCDGLVDNDVAETPCYDGPEGTVGVGLCKAGIQGCEAGEAMECVGQVLPATEDCNGVDDNCDGAADEGCECEPGVERECDGPPEQGLCKNGTQRCNPDGLFGDCIDRVEPVNEECDGEDNDCDGTKDEGCDCRPTSRRVCGNAVGECDEGVQICSDSGRWDEDCLGEVVGVREQCNSLDDDCDGIIDNDIGPDRITMGTVCDGIGECGTGLHECLTPLTFRCSTEPGGTHHVGASEECDGKDNDCDGVTDNGFVVRDDCHEGIGICRREGQTACNQQGDDTFCDVLPGAPREGGEICNFQDDDCDGATDEELGSTTCGIGACEATTANCIEGQVQVCEPDEPGDEGLAPNEIDDDCDDLVDEGFAALLFDGNDDTGVEIPVDDDLQLRGTDFTIEAWVRFRVFRSSKANAIVSRRAAGLGWMFGLTGNAHSTGPPENRRPGRSLFLLIDDWPEASGGDFVVATNEPPTSGVSPEWHHVAATYRMAGNVVHLFLDGHLVGDGALPNGPSRVPEATTLLGADGLLSGVNYGLNGFISDVRISTEALYSGVECDGPGGRCFAPEACLGTDDALDHWRLDEGNGTTATNSKSERPHGFIRRQVEGVRDLWVSDADNFPEGLHCSVRVPIQ